MTWHIYTSPRSPFVRKVMIAAHELGLADTITRTDVVTTPMTPAPELSAVNPMGMIPTLDTGEDVIFDSLTIMQFMNDRAEGSLFGEGAARYGILTRHALADAAMDKSVRILDEQFRTQNSDTQEHLDGYINAITTTIRAMQDDLDPARFDAGDICLAALLSYLDMRFPQIFWRENASTAADWFKTVSERPAMETTTFADPPFV